jgi:single-stranded-DNA-specific exonuclease
LINRRAWTEPIPHELPETVLDAVGGDVLLAEILLNRGYADPATIRAYLDPDAFTPAPPEQIPDLVAGSRLLERAIRDSKRILIWGDFDVDGQTATALLVDALTRLGANVAYYVPNRNSEGHGIKPSSLQAQITKYAPDVLVTCDTGITAFDAIQQAVRAGLTVIVTDHHSPTDHLPPAHAVVTNRRLHVDHPLADLPGVGVAYMLVQHLYSTFGRERETGRFLDLVALGIVGDVATQTRQTRYLLQLGLERLRHTERIGLKALLEVAQIPSASLSAEEIGFQIAPRLNAIGRLSDAMAAIDLLTTHDRKAAALIAQRLEGFNNERQLLTRQMIDAAETMIAETPSLLDYDVLILHGAEWHPGLLGIVAGRLAERYARPAVMLQGTHDTVRGSARSVEGIDIHHALSLCADMLRTFGGHPGAAGLSLDGGKVDAFRRRLSKIVAEIRQSPRVPPLQIDMITPFDGLSSTLAGRIRRLAPFGEGNPPVLLATMNLQLLHSATIGRAGQHRKLTLADEHGRQQQFLWWDSAREPLPGGRFDVAYTIALTNTASGDERFTLTFVDYRIREAAPEPAPPITIHDWRGDPDPLARLESVRIDDPNVLVWAEAVSRRDHPEWRRRAELEEAPSLAVFTIPPDPQTLREAIERVNPAFVYLFAVDPPISDVDTFLKTLAVGVRNVLEHFSGEVDLAVLCGATGQSSRVVVAGLAVLAAERGFRLTWIDESKVQIIDQDNGTTHTNPDKDLLRAKLDRAFAEVAAYRRMYRKMPREGIVK